MVPTPRHQDRHATSTYVARMRSSCVKKKQFLIDISSDLFPAQPRRLGRPSVDSRRRGRTVLVQCFCFPAENRPKTTQQPCEINPLDFKGNYSATSNNTTFCTLAVDGWAVTFGTARRGLGGLRPRPVPFSLYQM